MPVTFNLKKVKEAHYIYASCYCSDGRVVKSIGYTVEPQDFKKGTYIKAIGFVISDIKKAVEEHEALCKQGRKAVTSEDVSYIIGNIVSPGKKPKSIGIADGIAEYIKQLQAGKLLRDGVRANKSTLSSLKFANRIIIQFTNVENVSLESFTKAHLDKITNAMIGEGLSQNTISTYINAIVYFFKYTYKSWHNNPLHKEDKVLVTAENLDHAVYYKESEILALYKLNLTGNRELVRDIFVYGCFTCMRYSDHNAHSDINITKEFILLNNIKTGSNVAIPLHPLVKEILFKYGGKPPKADISGFNETIKKICRDAKGSDGKPLFHDKVTFKRTQGGKANPSIKFRWQLTTSHTMRRSFATNALLANVPEDYIMRIGGWKSHASFAKYKRATVIDIAKAAAAHPFFSGKAG